MRLRRSDPTSPGISRVRSGNGWRFRTASGDPVATEDAERARSLVIPPAWREVWISPHPNGHIQATGLDDAGRRQYLYHPDWNERRSRDKFAHLEDFAAALPRIRTKVSSDLRTRSLSKQRVLAATVRLLDEGYFRIGSESYAQDNGTIGLATLRAKDVAVRGGSTLAFCYRGKGALQVEVDVRDSAVAHVFAQLIERSPRPSAPLLGFEDDGGWHRLRSGDINAYLKEISEQPESSAKDFRTWTATRIAAEALAEAGTGQRTQRELKAAHNDAVKRAAEHLGNTPAVCRRAYIDPRVFAAHERGRVLGSSTDRALLRLLREQRN